MSLGGKYYESEELRKMGFAKIGKNVKIHSRASIYCPENIYIGDNVRIDDFAVIVATGKLILGSYNQIANFCFLGSKYEIIFSDFCVLASGVKIYTSSDDYSGNTLATAPGLSEEDTRGACGKVVLKRHSLIGTNSVVLPGVKIGEGCSVGALSLVNNDLDPWGIYAGIPVKFIKPRSKRLVKLEKNLHGSL